MNPLRSSHLALRSTATSTLRSTLAPALVAGLASGLVLLGGTAAGPAHAQAVDELPAEHAALLSVAGQAMTPLELPPEVVEAQDRFLGAVAGALGVDLETLKQAVAEVTPAPAVAAPAAGVLLPFQGPPPPAATPGTGSAALSLSPARATVATGEVRVAPPAEGTVVPLHRSVAPADLTWLHQALADKLGLPLEQVQAAIATAQEQVGAPRLVLVQGASGGESPATP
jgi:hypothetical protein